jgi:hypothetical protein
MCRVDRPKLKKPAVGGFPALVEVTDRRDIPSRSVAVDPESTGIASVVSLLDFNIGRVRQFRNIAEIFEPLFVVIKFRTQALIWPSEVYRAVIWQHGAIMTEFVTEFAKLETQVIPDQLIQLLLPEEVV